jgi:hypothetical protein
MVYFIANGLLNEFFFLLLSSKVVSFLNSIEYKGRNLKEKINLSDRL